jgi:hypothetical protein
MNALHHWPAFFSPENGTPIIPNTAKSAEPHPLPAVSAPLAGFDQQRSNRSEIYGPKGQESSG